MSYFEYYVYVRVKVSVGFFFLLSLNNVRVNRKSPETTKADRIDFPLNWISDLRLTIGEI